jgi:hypothetical protein
MLRHHDDQDQTLARRWERWEPTPDGHCRRNPAVATAIEGATLLQLGSLLTVHAFVAMLLIPLVALKICAIRGGRGRDRA